MEDDVTCCYARQDKVWVHGPGNEPWEVYTVKEDSASFGTNGPTAAVAGPGTTGATPGPRSADATER